MKKFKSKIDLSQSPHNWSSMESRMKSDKENQPKTKDANRMRKRLAMKMKFGLSKGLEIQQTTKKHSSNCQTKTLKDLPSQR